MINWSFIDDVSNIETIKEASFKKPQLIFKHSTRCSISSTAKNRLERNWPLDENQADVHYLDLIRYRDISNHIAVSFNVPHESPQVLWIQNGECKYDASHFGINCADFEHLVSAMEM
ncbi:MAG: bacillithiol system redox-active protein YtxJ [Saprospiraceae bacterium]|nr:bacillithiol system redox-active protein YtxJ [Saprospiraceae bacterium]